MTDVLMLSRLLWVLECRRNSNQNHLCSTLNSVDCLDKSLL